MDIDKIGKFLKEKRNDLGLSQNDLGEKLFVTRQAISSWENGKSIPDSDILLKLSDLFNVSINDILCGETIEKSLLELVDENNKKRSKINRLVKLFITTILISIVLLLGLYFINNYNSIKVYTAKANSTNFRIVDGIIISTSKNTYFKLGKLEKKDANIIINVIKLYYKENNKKEIVFEGDTNDRLFINNKGYDELYRETFHKYKDKLYIEVTYNDNKKEVLKLKLKEDFKNNYLISIDKNNIIKEEKSETISETPKIEEKDPPIEFMQPDNKQEIIEEKEEIQTETTDEPIINYKEIIDLIKEKSSLESNVSSIEYQLDNNLNVTIGLFKDNLMINTHNNMIEEKYIIKVEEEIMIHYTKTDNYNLVDRVSGNLDELSTNNKELIDNMNNYLLLLYNE